MSSTDRPLKKLKMKFFEGGFGLIIFGWYWWRATLLWWGTLRSSGVAMVVVAEAVVVIAGVTVVSRPSNSANSCLLFEIIKLNLKIAPNLRKDCSTLSVSGKPKVVVLVVDGPIVDKIGEKPDPEPISSCKLARVGPFRFRDAFDERIIVEEASSSVETVALFGAVSV